MASINAGWLWSRLRRQNGSPVSASDWHPTGASNPPSASAHCQDDLCGLADEKSFHNVLSLERKRAERTNDSFVLMCLELSGLASASGQERIAPVCAAILRQTRETDLPGWQSHPGTVGVIYTAIGKAERSLVQRALMGKADEALCAALAPDERALVEVSLHFFPEDFDKGRPVFKADEYLYPDLTSGNGRRLHTLLKRSLDIAGSLTGLIVFSPVLLLISILIKLTSQGPVLFKQRRIGKYGRDFEFLKFRTMHVGSGHDIHEEYVRELILKNREPTEVGLNRKPVYKIVKDPRITPLGRFLRKCSLDELPQFINVLRGEMSLVGPRPPIPYEAACYSTWHKRRVVEVKPGITGLWQVLGRSSTTFDEMVRLDLRYLREQSIWLDLKIIVQTPLVVISGKGAY